MSEILILINIKVGFMKRSSSKLFIYLLVLVILFLGLLNIIGRLPNTVYFMELLGFLFLLLLTVLAFFGYHSKWGERVLFFVFLFYALNLVLVWYARGSLYLILLVLALLGGVLSFPRKRAAPKKELDEPHSQVFDAPVPKKEAKSVAAAESAEGSVSASKVKYSPGKFVASKAGNTYHEPKCEWAKKIHKERRVWFAAKEEAWKKGYKAHGCVE